MTEPLASKPESATLWVTHLDALPAGTRLGEFEIARLLGVGGFGMVYQAFDHSLQRDVAIKEYMPVSLARRTEGCVVSVHSSADALTFQGGLKSFMSEARLLAQFDHPSLVKVFRFWEQNNTAYMVMPLYRGITLRQARSQMRCPPPEEWLRKLLWSMLGALKMLHSSGTMHRDISPENIFLQNFGPPVLLDLGAARRAIHEKDRQLTATLKFSYAPIEQYGETVDLRQGPWTDLYALAAVMHGCLTNEAPLPATLRVLRDRMPTFASVAHKVEQECGLQYSPAFVLTMDQALSIRPSARPKSASAFARLLELQTPSAMSKFNWRTELGDVYVPPVASASSHADALATTVALHTELPGTSPLPTQTLPPAPVPEFTAPAFSGGAVRAAPRLRSLLAGASAALALVVALGWIWSGSHEAPAPALVAEPSVAAQVPVIPASEPPLAVAAVTVSPEPEPPAPAVQAPAPKRGASPRPSVRARSVAAAPAASASQVPPGAAVPSAQASRNERIEEPQRKASTAPRAAMASAALARVPATLCADASFIARPMCIFEECKKPEFASLPVCVENARRLQEPRNLSN